MGLGLMLVDHAGRFLGLGLPGWTFLGRVCFPLFALSCGVQAGLPGVRDRVSRRLLVVGLLVWPVFFLVTGEVAYDVLVTLAFGLCAGDSLCRGGARGWCCAALCLVGASLGEYGAPGALLVASGVLWVEADSLALVCALAGSAGLLARGEGAGSVMGVALGFLVCAYGPCWPRARRVFMRCYLGQWPLLWALRAWGV